METHPVKPQIDLHFHVDHTSEADFSRVLEILFGEWELPINERLAA